jgi:uncharacterized repeat protein (TIGR03803 family)
MESKRMASRSQYWSAYLLAGVVALSIVPTSNGASAAMTLTTLHSFCKEADCKDWRRPGLMPLSRDAAGNLYGVTDRTSLNQKGMVYKLAWDGTKFTYHPLYRFCRKQKCADGYMPDGHLAIDTLGNIFGTTLLGGKYGAGVAFELVFDSSTGQWNARKLHDFCAEQYCADGNVPFGLTFRGQESGAAYDGTSPLFGAVEATDVATGGGGIFQLTYVPGKTTREERLIYKFCSQPNCTDGNQPTFVRFDAAGNLVGTTAYGGSANSGYGGTLNGGTVFELSPNGTSWVETVLYSFCALTSCADGERPNPALAQDGNGNFFGMTLWGGTAGRGALFKVVPNGARSKYTVLYSFCQKEACVDGAAPWGGVVVDANGNMFGTTYNGGGSDSGVVFRLKGKKYSKLHEFCAQAACTDGQNPAATLVQDAAGNLFGTTENGGAFGNGTVFELKP